MSKKKAIKLVAASAIAASSFAAVAPHNADAAVSVSKTVKDAKAKMYKPFKTYFYADSYVKVGTVEAQVKDAKKAYDSAKKVIAKYGGKKKNAYYADLKASYKYITRAQSYVDGARAAYYDAQDMKEALEVLNASVEAEKFDDVKAQYEALTSDVAAAEKAIKVIYGSDAEKIVEAKYTAPIKDALASDELKAAYELSKDKTAPVLTVSELASTVDKAEQTLTVSTDDEKATVVVTLNGTEVSKGEKGYALTLKEGENTIVVTATDAAGNKEEKTIEVKFVKLVDSVSAITRTGVTFTIKAPTEDVEGFTVKVLDNTGKEVALTASDVLKGQKEVYLKFATALTADPTGIWTVGGVKFDLDTLKKIQDIVTYSSSYNEVKLYDALVAAGIQGVKVGSLSAYATEVVNSSADTLAEIQAAVTKVNDQNVSLDEKVAVLGSLFDAKDSAVKVRSALATSPFERVNSDWVAVTGGSNDYTETLNSVFGGITVKSDITTSNAATLYDAVQAGINTVNNTNVDLYKATVTDVTKANTYKSLVVSYVKNDAVNETAKAVKLAYADKAIALAQLKVTTSPVEAYRLLVTLLNIDTTDSNTSALLNENNKQDYFTSLVAYQPTIAINSVSSDTTVAAIVSNVITAGDATALSTALDAIEDIEDNSAAPGAADNGTALSTVKANLVKLSNVTSHKTGAAKFDVTKVDDAKLADYRTALAAFDASSDDLADVTASIASVNDQASLNVYLDTVSKSNDVTAVTTALTNLANAFKADSDAAVSAHALAFLNANSTVKSEVVSTLIAQRNDEAAGYVPANTTTKVFTKAEIFGVASGAVGALDSATTLHTTNVALFEALGDLGGSPAPTSTELVDAIDEFVAATNDAHAWTALSIGAKLAVAEKFLAFDVTVTSGSSTSTHKLDFTNGGTEEITTIAKGYEWINKFMN